MSTTNIVHLADKVKIEMFFKEIDFERKGITVMVQQCMDKQPKKLI